MDTVDNSGLKIEARDFSSLITGKIYYCTDAKNCIYVEIGRVMGWVTDAFIGFFYSPFVNGAFRIIPKLR